jgi:muramoyltetrapeptide carboxypeptidase LdcA involved in peptidoglycan recycling
MRIGVVCPSSLIDTKCLTEGMRGFRAGEPDTVLGKSCFGYLSPKERAEELYAMEALCDVLICARGGSGSFQMQKYLSRGIRIPVVGYSDITFLLLWQHVHSEKAIHGPMVLDLSKDAESMAMLRNFIHDEIVYPFTYPKTMKHLTLIPGKAAGRILAANLSLLMPCLSYFGHTVLNDTILFLEDVHESVDSLERYLWTLSNLPSFSGVNGIVFSAFTETRRGSNPYYLGTLLQTFAEEFAKPCFIGFPAYHGSYRKMSLPIGAAVEIDSVQGNVTLLESGG